MFMCWNPQGSGALDVIITLSAVILCVWNTEDGFSKRRELRFKTCNLGVFCLVLKNAASFYFYFTVYLYFPF